MSTTARAQEIGNRPYQEYQGQRTAAFDPGFDQARDRFNAAGANDPSAMNTLNGLQPGQGIGQYQAGNVQPLDFNQGQVDKYMNPYVNNVIGANMDIMNRQFDRDAVTRRMQSARAGAYGDYGRQVGDAVAMGDNNRQMQQMVYSGLSDAYNQAGSMFGDARSAQMQADQMNIGDRQFAADFGMRGQDQRFQQGLGLAQGYNTINNDNMQRNLAVGDALSGDAARRMGYNQAALDTQYSDFRDKNLWDQQQTSWLTNILYGNPESVNTTYGTQYSSPLAQVAGLGLAGYGMYNQSQGGGG